MVQVGVYCIGSAIGAVASGACADYFGRKPILLTALSFWLVVTASTAGAWNDVSFMTLRLLSGVGIGGQLALLAVLAIEYTPTQTRGRITILAVSMAGLGVCSGVGYGQLAGPATKDGGIGWRPTYGILSAIALLVAAVLYRVLEESPKYLASVGRAEEALCIIEKIETAHGISRQARVTVPTSLYQPPSERQPPLIYDDYSESSSESDGDVDVALQRGNTQEDELQNREGRILSHASYNYAGPGAAKARSRSQRVSARRLQSRHQYQANECSPALDDPEISSRTLASAVNGSFLRVLVHRVVALFSGRLAIRTVAIWLFWFAQLMSLSAAVVTTLMMAKPFIKVNDSGTSFGVGDQLFWSGMAFPGLLLAATMVDNVGRRSTLALFVSCGGAILLLSALLLREDGNWIGLSLALGAIVLTTSGTLGALTLLTGEQFTLHTRALGLSCAIAWGYLGMFAGDYLVLQCVIRDDAWSWHDERLMLALCGGASILLLPVILLMGPETRGVDIDASWLEDKKYTTGGVLSVIPSGRSKLFDAGHSGAFNDSSDGSSRGIDKQPEPLDENGRALLESSLGRRPMNGMAAPAMYSSTSATLATVHSSEDSDSISRSSSTTSNFWQTHSMRHLSNRMMRAAHAITRTSGEKHVVRFSSGAKKQACSASVSKQTRGDIDDRCSTVRLDDLDHLENIVTEHDCQHTYSSLGLPDIGQSRRQSDLGLTDPVLLEWRSSISSSQSGSALNCSSSNNINKRESSDCTDTVASARYNRTGRYTIDLDMFDTFTYISTPVLGGDDYTNHEHREPSNLSSASGSETKQASR
uniref:Major facilitator superfamily (MFS) profile domain-containing protein n=1 Tax=Hyaloperonospora arabidopsidis (strain Emoy2) TaxID=559515 RepID=M4BTT0_HYAAE